jgi:hypothetical protein
MNSFAFPRRGCDLLVRHGRRLVWVAQPGGIAQWLGWLPRFRHPNALRARLDLRIVRLMLHPPQPEAALFERPRTQQRGSLNSRYLVNGCASILIFCATLLFGRAISLRLGRGTPSAAPGAGFGAATGPGPVYAGPSVEASSVPTLARQRAILALVGLQEFEYLRTTVARTSSLVPLQFAGISQAAPSERIWPLAQLRTGRSRNVSLPGESGPAGPQGAQRVAGPTGDPGPAGPQGAAGSVRKQPMLAAPVPPTPSAGRAGQSGSTTGGL